MKFINNINKNEYINFCKKFPNNHFLQSYEWGQVNKLRDLTPCYVGIKGKNDKLIAAALLLKKNTPLNMSYFYSPRGLLVDYNNKELLDFFIKELKIYLQKENAIYLKIDPGIKYHDIDDNGNKKENGTNNYSIFDNLIDLGFKHQGFNKLYEKNQPRYTFRINTKVPMEEIDKKIHKSFMRPIKRNYFYDLDIYKSDNIINFYNLVKLISNKDGFQEYSLEFYQKVYEEFSKQDNFTLFEVKIYPDKLITKIKEELKNKKKLEQSQINRLEKDLKFFSSLPESSIQEKVIASVILLNTNNRAWALYIGNDKIAQYTFTVNRLYYEFTKDANEKGFEFVDLFGTTGDPKTTYKNLAALHEYKRKFGGEYIEFIGEFDLIIKPIWYKILPIILKIYRKLRG